LGFVPLGSDKGVFLKEDSQQMTLTSTMAQAYAQARRRSQGLKPAFKSFTKEKKKTPPNPSRS